MFHALIPRKFILMVSAKIIGRGMSVANPVVGPVFPYVMILGDF